MSLDSKIEAILFHKAEPVTEEKLAKILEKESVEIAEALNKLEQKLSDRGIQIVRHAGKVMLGTSGQLSGLISKITKEELEGELGKAGLETLSVVLYKGPVSKKEIDYIRGVNSSYILRNLLVKGLIEKAPQKEGRSVYYQGTLELLAYMGLKNVLELPEYAQTREKMGQLEKFASS